MASYKFETLGAECCRVGFRLEAALAVIPDEGWRVVVDPDPSFAPTDADHWLMFTAGRRRAFLVERYFGNQPGTFLEFVQ